MVSLWRNQTPAIVGLKRNNSIEFQDIRWDVIVIGAGMAGILTAFYLQESGKKVLVLEAKTVGSGQTERTTAKITSQHGLKYSKLIQNVGYKKARLYAEANESAIKEYESLIQKRNISCQFERVPAYLYTRQDESLLEIEAKAASDLGIHANFTKETELPFQISGAVCFQDQACFSPLEFLQNIAGDINIKEHTKVTAIRGNKVISGETEFTAEKIVVATHFPIFNVPGFYFLRQHQERSYVLSLLGTDKITGMYLGIDPDGLSFRQAGKYLLLGGSSVRTGENKVGGAYDTLKMAALQYFPDCKIEKCWAAQDCMPHDGIPLIGKYSFFTPDLYVATGFQKWGMTSSMIAAQLLCDEICGRENLYAELFRPQRMNLRAGAVLFGTDVCQSVKGLTKGVLAKKLSDALIWDVNWCGIRMKEVGIVHAMDPGLMKREIY